MTLAIAWLGSATPKTTKRRASQQWRGPVTGTALRSGETVCIEDFATEERMAKWKQRASEHGYASSIALPLIDHSGSTLGAMTIYSAQAASFTPAEISLLEELAADLAYGITVLRSRKKQLESDRALRTSQETFVRAFEMNPSMGAIVDLKSTVYLTVNRAWEIHTGYSRDEVIGKTTEEIGVVMAEEDARRLELLESTGEVNDLRIAWRDRCGDEHVGTANSVFVEIDGVPCAIHMVDDVTERDAAERALRASENKFRAAFFTSPDSVNINRLSDGLYLETNQGFTDLTGYTSEDVEGKTSADISIWADPADRALLIEGLRTQGVVTNLEAQFRRKDGSVTTALMSARLIDLGGEKCILSVTRDIADRKAVEEELRQSERWLLESQRIAQLGHYVFDIASDRWKGSPSLYDVLGVDADLRHDFAGWLEAVHPSDRDRMARYFAEEVVGRRSPFDMEYRVLRPCDGAERWARGLGNLEFSENGEPVRMFGIIQDITDHKLAEESLRLSEERYRSISETVTSFVYSCRREPGDSYRIDWMAGAVKEMTGYTAEEITARTCWRFMVQPEDRPVFDANVIELRAGESATAEFRIVVADGEVLWVRSTAPAGIVSGQPDTHALVGSLEDITQRKHAENALLDTNARLEDVLKSITKTMGRVVETRDPYTQGHEQGVARLAVQIAEEMGLSEDEIETIEVGALVHDIGKLSVPAEILTRPGKLGKPEFSLIKGHPESGYQILKDIDFGRPIAEIALQHHERIDGSGYPNGLLGEEILLAARVVAVADVIEAMAAHRPYRPALGLDVAIEEIRGHPDKYDRDVIAACMRLYDAGRIELSPETGTPGRTAGGGH